ncbi:MAG: flagellin [Verrucomicrobiae bacterium]
MSLSINTNSSASQAASNLNSTNTMLQKSLQRLSSGTRIVDSSDDAGGLAVSMKMSAAIRRTEATSTNLSNAQSFLKTQDGAFSTATKVLTRMSELATLSQDVTKTSGATGDTGNYQTEFAALQSQLTALGSGTFNGVAMFTTAAAAATSTVYTNEDSTTSTTITKAALTGSTEMSNAISTTGTSISSVGSAVAATATINTALASLATMRAQNGSESSKLKFGQEMLTTNKNNLEAANSRIIDVDVAAESTQLARFNILQQAGTAMLAQANQSAQSVLRLLS